MKTIRKENDSLLLNTWWQGIAVFTFQYWWLNYGVKRVSTTFKYSVISILYFLTWHCTMLSCKADISSCSIVGYPGTLLGREFTLAHVYNDGILVGEYEPAQIGLRTSKDFNKKQKGFRTGRTKVQRKGVGLQFTRFGKAYLSDLDINTTGCLRSLCLYFKDANLPQFLY